MAIQETSAKAYRELKAKRRSQEQRLFEILSISPSGLTDRQIAKRLGVERSLASARRNGLKKRLQQDQDSHKLECIGKTVCKVTFKTVKVWGLVRKIADGIQQKLPLM